MHYLALRSAPTERKSGCLGICVAHTGSVFTNGISQHTVKVKMDKHIEGDDANIALFVDARRKLLQLNRAKKTALRIADLHFPKTHPFRKSVQNFCGGNCEFRYQAEIAACRTADKYGDQLFRVVIDGIHMSGGPTDFLWRNAAQVECQRWCAYM